MEADEFKKFSFITVAIPGVGGAIAMIALLGLAVFVGAGIFLKERLIMDPVLFATLFVCANIAAGFVLSTFVKHFKAKWAYLLVLVNEIILILIAGLFTFLEPFNLVEALALWSIIAYATWLITFSSVASMKINKGIFLSFVQPVLVWLLALSSINTSGTNIATPMIVAALGISVSAFILLFTEHLFSLVFSGLSGMAELSKFMKGVRGEQASLSIGHNIDSLVQYMKFRAETKESVIVAPWLHSGPIRGVGGGNLSTQVINKLNKEGGDSYFLHIPSNHEYNPSVDVSGRIVRALEPGAFERLRVSKVVKVEEGGVSVRGQMLNDTYLISLSSTHIDDYDISIFSGLRDKYDKKRVIFIDSHPNVPFKECTNVEMFTAEAEIIEKLVDQAIKKLSVEPKGAASVGTAIQYYEEYSVFAMVLKSVETTLYFIVDANGLSQSEIETIKSIAKNYGIDRTLLFTTDTHSLTVKTLMNRPDMPRAIIESTINRALTGLKPGEFAYSESLVKNVRILGKTYYELSTVVKIMARVMPTLFLLVFLFMTVLLWIF